MPIACGPRHMSSLGLAPMIAAALFDFHDTLAHLQASTNSIVASAIGVSESACRSAWLQVEARIRERQETTEWPPPPDQRWPLIYSWMFEFLGVDGDPAQPLAVLQGFFQDPDNYGLFDDAIPTLERFAESGLAIGIVSNSDFDLWPVLKKLGIDTLVDIALPTISLGIEKPHPEAYRSACRELGVAPQDAVFIGDNVELDGYGALAAGLRPILIDREGIHQNLALAFPVVTDLLAAWPLVTPR